MIILGWNRDQGDTWPDYDNARASCIEHHGIENLGWSVGNHVNIKVGEMCCMLVQGQKHPRGLVAWGVVVDAPAPDLHYDPDKAAKGVTTNYVRWAVQGMLPADDVIPVSLLASEVPEVPWLTGIYSSGQRVPEVAEGRLLALWKKYGVDQSGVSHEDVGGSIPKEYREGVAVPTIVTRYERNARARQACLDHYGYVCVVCDIDLTKNFGDDVGYRSVHVHHVTPLHVRGGVDHNVDPIKDLRPLCPNCHTAIHKFSPVPTPAQLRARLSRIQLGKN